MLTHNAQLLDTHVMGASGVRFISCPDDFGKSYKVVVHRCKDGLHRVCGMYIIRSEALALPTYAGQYTRSDSSFGFAWECRVTCPFWTVRNCGSAGRFGHSDLLDARGGWRMGPR